MWHWHKQKKVYEGGNVVIQKGEHSVWDFPGHWIVYECEGCGLQTVTDSQGRPYAEALAAMQKERRNGLGPLVWDGFRP